MFAQSYLYNVPSERLTLRAAISSAVVSLFFTFWVMIDQRIPDTYDTIFEFSPYSIEEVDRFEAIRLDAAGNNNSVVFEKPVAGRRGTNHVDPDGDTFSENNPDWMVIALEIEEDGKKVRFETPTTTLKVGNQDRVKFDTSEENAVVYHEVDGDRYMEAKSAGRIFDPRAGVLIGNLLLNIGHFFLWWVVIWLGLRYNWGHALGFAFLFWVASTVFLVPILLEQN